MTERLSVSFIWHMHQPLYKDRLSGLSASLEVIEVSDVAKPAEPLALTKSDAT